MAAQTAPAPLPRLPRARWRRLPIAVLLAAAIGGCDLAWKLSSLAAAHAALDTPTSLLKPLATIAVGLLALGGTLVVPACLLPGTLLVLAGVAANLASLALWHAVPDPLALPLAGGVLHFNLADTCVVGGGVLFTLGAWWAIWRMPAERFA